MIGWSTRPWLILLLAGLWLWDGEARAQDSKGREINYRLVPNLEPMKDAPPAPDFTLPRLTERNSSGSTALWALLRRWWKPDAPGAPEEKVSLSNFRGKLVFLNFWASWCIPCRQEMPEMERLYQEFQKRGFVVLAVNIKDNHKDAVAFMKELKFTYPTLFDPQGEVGLLYGAFGLPTTYLIGRKGQTLARLWGPASWYSPGARQLIKTLLEEKK